MSTRLQRRMSLPIREGLDWDQRWRGADRGLIFCWERGRQKRVEDTELADRATKGELVTLAWKGGVDRKVKNEQKVGTLRYLATWQGLRGEDLDIQVDEEITITCAVTGQPVVFQASVATATQA